MKLPSPRPLMVLLLTLAPAVQADVPIAAYRQTNAELIEHHVLPRYQSLVEASEGLDATAQGFCQSPTPDGLNELDRAYRDTLTAWMGVQHLRFGPAVLLLRNNRFFFSPDPRDKAGEQLAELLEQGDPQALTPEKFRNTSVAVQGLPALERLLWNASGPANPAAGEGGEFRCRVVTAITQNLAEMARGMLEDWQGGRQEFTKVITHPGDDNPYYGDDQAATLDFFKSLHNGLQEIVDIKLKPVLGEDISQAQPKQAESWRSGLSLEGIISQLEALKALYLGEGGKGLGGIATAHGEDRELDPLLRKAFDMTLATARGIEPPLSEAVADPQRRPQVEKLYTQTRALKQIIKDRLTAALDLTVGFNAYDGD